MIKIYSYQFKGGDINHKPYFEQNNFVLYLGDCIKILKQFPENYFDMIFADPPYNLSNGGITCHAGRMVKVDKGKWDKSNGIRKDFEFHFNWIKECKRVLKPAGTIWISGTYHSIYKCGYALQALYYKILNDICWFKPAAAPNLSGRYFTASHETLIWAKKEEKAKHYFNYELMKKGNWNNDWLKNPGKQMRSVWSINPPKSIEKKFGKHPTQKPEELLKRIILASTKENDLILDPFAGSSTTGIMAYLLNRNFIGIDNEEKYLELSVKRFRNLENNMKKKKLLFK